MNALDNLKADLDVAMSEVRLLLELYYGAENDWREYLILRSASNPDRYIVLAHPSDKSDFQEKLVRLHRKEAILRPQVRTSALPNSSEKE